MAEADATVAVVLHYDPEALLEALAAEENSVLGDALSAFASLIREVLLKLVGFSDYSHVELLNLRTAYKDGDVDSPLCLVVGPAAKGAEGQLQGVQTASYVFDLLGALTAQRMLPDLFTDKVGLDEHGALGFTDEVLGQRASALNQRLGLDEEGGGYTGAVSEEGDAELVEALGALVPEDAELVAVHPEDLLALLPVYVDAARLRGYSLQRTVWRVEDVGQAALQLSTQLLRHAARPLLVALVLHRAARVVSDSKGLEYRLARMSLSEGHDYYMRNLLGDDYEQQIQQDLQDAVREVDEGLVTDDYKDEKRLLTAAMLRRLEVEEWDKERMKHFYYGSYGLGPWYFDMEERLHNPFFIGARAWNGPIEGWVNKNRVRPTSTPPRGQPCDHLQLLAGS
ncbi:hypothetical protein V8C86DRAFT_2920902 [Haematococcus lacustris]